MNGQDLPEFAPSSGLGTAQNSYFGQFGSNPIWRHHAGGRARGRVLLLIDCRQRLRPGEIGLLYVFAIIRSGMAAGDRTVGNGPSTRGRSQDWLGHRDTPHTGFYRGWRIAASPRQPVPSERGSAATHSRTARERPGGTAMQEESVEREAGRCYPRRSLVQGASAGGRDRCDAMLSRGPAHPTPPYPATASVQPAHCQRSRPCPSEICLSRAA